MKTFIQKLPLTGDISFVARTFRTPEFEVPWHQHIEYELILFTEGGGLSFIGNYVGEFETGDIFFLGKNLPHTFQKRNPDMITSAVVVQFRDDFWGSGFIEMPEARAIKRLFDISSKGLEISGKSKLTLITLIKELEFITGLQRVINLCSCLSLIEQDADLIVLSTQEIKQKNQLDKERIDKIFQYTIESFRTHIDLSYVAQKVDMSVPAFCNYFKKSTKKTYVNFLNEIRIGNACTLLIETQLSIIEVCYESGFNTPANFNKQFLKIKKLTPSKYRRKFKNSVAIY